MKKNLLFVLAFSSILSFSQYNNGGLSTGATSNSGVSAPAGYTWSEAQNETGNTTESNTTGGYGCQKIGAATSNFCADDFTVPTGETWNVSSIEFFGYQTGYAGATSPFVGLTLNIFSSDPSVTGAVSVFGDDTTNRLTSSSDALMYRIFNSSVPSPGSATGTTRRIWKVSGNATTTLTAGTYWLKFQLDAGTSGNFAPPVTIKGTRGLPTFNGKQYQSSTSTWANLIDGGNPSTAPDYPMDMPFVVNYTTLGTNEVLQYDNRLVVYPNPTRDFFRLQLPNESKSAKTVVTLYDMSGKEVKKFNYAESYDISKLSSGAYVIKVNDGQNIKVTKIFKAN